MIRNERSAGRIRIFRRAFRAVRCTVFKKSHICLSDKCGFYGAGDEARIRYLHLGKVALYRMSYTRITQMHGIL